MSVQNRLYLFLHAVRGNWRNAIFIECKTCTYGHSLCSGYLMAMDSDGLPLLLSAGEFQKLTGEDVHKDECRRICRSSDFESLYELWLGWQIDSSKECAILQLFWQQNNKA